MENLLKSINNAFFRLESFLNGNLKEYKYFGFDSSFTKLFKEVKKQENFTYENCKLIGDYYKLLSQLNHSLDKADYANNNASDSEDLFKEWSEIDNLSWERVDEFCEFSTQDEIDEFEKKFSINDILKIKYTYPINKFGKSKNSDTGLKLREIALSFALQGKSIPKSKSNEIAKSFGYKSGDKLYRLFLEYVSRTDRKAKPHPFTKIKLQNKIKLFEKVIKILPEENKQEALDELSILKGYKPDDY